MARASEGQAGDVADYCSLAWAVRPGGGRADYRSVRHPGQARGFRTHFSINSPLDTSSYIDIHRRTLTLLSRFNKPACGTVGLHSLLDSWT